MFTKLTIRNFKSFKNVEIELGKTVVLIGPNNSGKTTALQALALWDLGLKRWNEKRKGKEAPAKRPGVTINRRDLIAVPVPITNLLWRDLHVRNVGTEEGKQVTKNIRIDIIVEGTARDRLWRCGLEFDYANDETFFCRPLRLSGEKNADRMEIPDEASNVHVAFLPPMSGLASTETRLDAGAINVRIGEGRTAEVLRNLCYRIASGENESNRWNDLKNRIQKLFGVTLDEPEYIVERGEIALSYRTKSGTRLDLSSSGRGMQQTLLLLAHLELNPSSVLLLDEPDAHLEILRQRQIYEVMTRVATERNCQIIAASHSEVLLNEAAGRDVVIAFLGEPHRIDDRGSHLLKALKEIGFDQYYQAERTGWVLFLEGSTDLAILRGFAEILDHPAKQLLEQPFVKYIENKIMRARDIFHGLREAKRDLVGFVLCDRIEAPLKSHPDLIEHAWKRREIENYLCDPETLYAYARGESLETFGPLFDVAESERRLRAMRASVAENAIPSALANPDDPWWINMKASDDFLDRVFKSYLTKLGTESGVFRKNDYHELARYVSRERIDHEVIEVLDQIVGVSERTRPAEDY